MKKFVIVIALVTILGTGTAFADHPDNFGIGFKGGFDLPFMGYDGYAGGGALLLKFPSVPIFWGVDVHSRRHSLGFGLSGDYYIINDNIVDEWFGWYLGLGGFLKFSTWDNRHHSRTNLGLVFRVPIGLSFQWPIDSFTLELFLAAVPNVGLRFSFWDSKHNDYWKNENYGRVGVWGPGLGGEIGIRFWF